MTAYRAHSPAHRISSSRREIDDLQIENVVVAGLDALAQLGGGTAVEIDARHGRFGPFEDDVLRLLDVEIGEAEMVEHVREHTRPVAMPDDQHVRRRRAPG